MVPDGTTLTIEDARIIYRNFEGRESEYNEEGSRNFSVVLEESQAKGLHDDGWNVKTLKPREEGDEPGYHLPVAVGFKIRPPRIVMITSRGRTQLDESTCGLLDWADIVKVDMIIRARHWAKAGNSGVKAYLQSIYITVREDELELKYADTPEASEEPPF